jgi:hypothetical protein
LKSVKSPLSRLREWQRKRKQKGKEKEEAKKHAPAEPEKPKEPTDEETEESTQEAEEPTSKSAVEKTEELAQEPSTEKPEEPTAEPAAEEEKELAPEPPTQETEETTAEPIAEEKEEELAPEQPLAEKTEKPTPKPRRFGLPGLFKRKQKKKEKERAPELPYLNILTFVITLASMLLGLSIMPLFPQPLPAILALLIAFVTYKRPIFGMPVGGLLIGLGLMYNLAKLNFISMLGETQTREIVVIVFLFLFTALPIIFHSRKAAITINMGIIAAISLFFGQIYFLAIPIILSAVVLFKKTSVLTVIYYVLLSVPLQIMQYLQTVLPIERWDWWIEPGTSPPIFVPLTQVFKDVQESMIQFRLYDTSLVMYSITDQFTATPPPMAHNVLEMLSHYFDSFPGIILFLVMVIGVVSVIAIFMRTFFAKSNIAHAERLFPTLTATMATALFFILASGLQGPLAFRVDIDSAKIVVGTLAAAIFTIPAFLIDTTPKKRATVEMILEKAKDLEAKLHIFEEELNTAKSGLPISCGAIEAKMLIIKDKLDDIRSKTSTRLYEASETDEIFTELEGMSKEIDNLLFELNISISEYQMFVTCEYSKWIGQFKDIGLEAKSTARTDFQRDMPLKTRIERIKEVLEGGALLASEGIQVAEQVYDTIRSLYDPNLPEKSQSIAFAKKKLDEKEAPWMATEALFISLNNWRKQYYVQISKSVENLQSSLASIANLTAQNEKLLPVLGDDFSKLMDHAKKAEDIKISIERKNLNAVDVLIIRDAFESSLSIARDVLSILYENMKSKEKAIESLAPSEDYLWEKNESLNKKMASAMKILLNSSKYEFNQVLETLPKSLSYVDECIKTITSYSEKEELLLNYPIAEMAVEDLFRQKKCISAQDLPFEPKYAEEFLKLFHSQRFREFSFDETGMALMRKT